MKIGSLQLENITIAAPLAGISNLPFRVLMKEAGCALVCSEMISANGLVYRSRKTLQLMDSLPEEKPLSVQIFGSDPSIMAEAAAIVQDSGADILDINFGCSVRKVVRTGAGVALMRSPGNAEEILSAVKKAISLPMTVKIRSGWDGSGNQAIEIARIAEDCGADAVTVHPRTASQGFSGTADRSVIARVKQALSIPVIGNGDISAPEHALRMLEETGCDAVMVGRAAVGNPWIFSGILSLLRGETPVPAALSLRCKAMIRYLDASVAYFGEDQACRMMRSRLGAFVKGLSHSADFRESLKGISSREEAVSLIRSLATKQSGVLNLQFGTSDSLKLYGF